MLNRAAALKNPCLALKRLETPMNERIIAKTTGKTQFEP
jgi:hypothetical protein